MTLTVGLNALHLVPGETGGSELYARCLPVRSPLQMTLHA